MTAQRVNEQIRYRPDEACLPLVAAAVGLQGVALVLAPTILIVAVAVRASGEDDAYLTWAAFPALIINLVIIGPHATLIPRPGSGHFVISGPTVPFVALSNGAGNPGVAYRHAGRGLQQRRDVRRDRRHRAHAVPRTHGRRPSRMESPLDMRELPTIAGHTGEAEEACLPPPVDGCAVPARSRCCGGGPARAYGCAPHRGGQTDRQEVLTPAPSRGDSGSVAALRMFLDARNRVWRAVGAAR